jgi:hypothetical protein
VGKRFHFLNGETDRRVVACREMGNKGFPRAECRAIEREHPQMSELSLFLSMPLVSQMQVCRAASGARTMTGRWSTSVPSWRTNARVATAHLVVYFPHRFSLPPGHAARHVPVVVALGRPWWENGRIQGPGSMPLP